MDALFKQISIGKLARYGYSGFLTLLIIYAYKIEPINGFITKENVAFIIPAIFIFGTVFYIFHRYIIGGFLLYPITYYIHRLFEIIIKIKEEDTTIPILYLMTLIDKKNYWNARRSYTYLRGGFFTKEQTEILDYYHTEIHLLYTTAVIGFAFIFGIKMSHWLCSYPIPDTCPSFNLSLSIISFVSWATAVIVDIQQHEREGRVLKYGIRKPQLENFLKKYGMISGTVVY